MPFQILEKTDSRWVAIWQITETTSFFEKQLPKEDKEYVNSKYSVASSNEKLQKKQEEKKLERLAVRLLVKNLVEKLHLDYTFLDKTSTGKPFLSRNKSLKLSISHDFPFCAAIIDLNNEVGIDIQSLTPKISRVFHRVMSESEQQNAKDLELQTLFWSAKEALYKYADEEGLFFKEDLNVKLDTENNLLGKIKHPLFSNKWLPLSHHTFEHQNRSFILVWL